MDWPPRRSPRMRQLEKKWVAIMTGLMAMTAYSSLIVLFPEHHPDPRLGSFDGLTVGLAMLALAVWLIAVLPFIRYVEPTR